MKRLLLVLLVLLFVQPEEPRPVPPAWLVGKMHLLPPVSRRAIDSMRTAWRVGLDDSYVTKPMRDNFLRAQKTIADLGDDAARALIWVYVQDPPLAEWRKYQTAINKADILHDLYEDGKAAWWLVPLLRERLAWAEQQLKNGGVDDTWFSANELGAIEGYITVHGTDDDLRNVFRMMDEFRASKTQMGRQIYSMTPEYLKSRWEVAMYRRESTLKRLLPYDEQAQRHVEEKPDLRLMETEAMIRKLEGKADKRPEYWGSLWVTVLVAAGLYWFMFRKRKPYGTSGRQKLSAS